MKTQIEQIIGEQIEITKQDNYSVDFKTLDGAYYWAKLTKTGKVKLNSIRTAKY